MRANRHYSRKLGVFVAAIMAVLALSIHFLVVPLFVVVRSDARILVVAGATPPLTPTEPIRNVYFHWATLPLLVGFSLALYLLLRPQETSRFDQRSD